MFGGQRRGDSMLIIIEMPVECSIVEKVLSLLVARVPMSQAFESIILYLVRVAL